MPGRDVAKKIDPALRSWKPLALKSISVASEITEVAG